MILDEVKKLLGADWQAVLDTVRRSLESDIPLLNRTNASLLSKGGKQIRPAVTLLCARICGDAVSETAIRYAAAVELLHNATLLHDDVADEADTRRGLPTVRALMGPSASVLIGDFWLVRALHNLFGGDRETEAIRLASLTLQDLAEGEMLQLQRAEQCDTDEADYLRIIDCKTASLFVTAARLAALSADAAPEQTEAVASYALFLGRAFQIRDDILDYTGDGGFGKPLGVDLREHKMTLPLLGALSRVDPAEALRIRARVRDFSGDAREEASLRAFVLEHGGIPYAQEHLERDTQKAVAALSVFPDGEDRRALEEIARFTGRRTV